MSLAAWMIPLAFFAGFYLAARLADHVTADRLRRQRRIGWAYGYGAGFTDALRGRPERNEPPADGYARPSGPDPAAAWGEADRRAEGEQ